MLFVTPTKANAVDVYRSYARYKGFKAEDLPRFNRDSPLPFIPQQSEIDALISGCGRKTSTILLLLKETAFRPIEGLWLRWDDIDVERRIINLPKPAKYSRPRQPAISPRLLSMLINIPHNPEYIFVARAAENHEKPLRFQTANLYHKSILHALPILFILF